MTTPIFILRGPFYGSFCFMDIPMVHIDPKPFFFKGLLERVGQADRTMRASGAAETHREIGLSLSAILGNQKTEQGLHLLHEAARFRPLQDEILYFPMGTVKWLQVRTEIGVGKEADVQHKVALG